MKKLLVAFVLLLTFINVTTAQIKQWSFSTTVENIDVQFNAVTIGSSIDSYYLTALGSISQGWTADLWGDMYYVGPASIAWESEYMYFGNYSISDCDFTIYLTGPQGDKFVEIYLYYDNDLGQFQLETYEY